MSKHALKTTREQNFADWYQELIKEAQLADSSCVRGCMVIKPYGYAIWEIMKDIFDKKIKEFGIQNAYFPLLIPLEFLAREAEHVEGFAKECAVVTHHKLSVIDGKIQPDGKLEEPYVIRPTSETIIGESFSKWINSYRDLPMKINQWANVMRWEKRTRMFLRTSEFLWQEGHCAFSSEKDADEDAKRALEAYDWFHKECLAIYGLKGQKTEDEKFAGAVRTYSIEPMMQDGKALQSCTAHYLGQNFAKSSGIKFIDENSQEQYAYTSSWGSSTRMMGGLFLSHSDDDGLVLPPVIAPYQIVIIPVIHNDEEKEKIMDYCNKVKSSLKDIRVYLDDSYKTPQDKKWEWVKKGAPIRVEIGMKEVENNSIFYVLRTDLMNKNIVNIDEFIQSYSKILNDMQKYLLEKNKKHLFDNIVNVDSINEVAEVFKKSTKFVSIDKKYWKDPELEKVMEEFSLSYRNMPYELEGKMIIGKAY